ncbi:hypothetical protein CRP01_07905 [Flavilitoribacter nigricans DSM 23189 = NBRC 102662]|uniref:Uncharacterized protein n=2 Tax=Flavilitoribacter TaxID=2762562 RepID=A0A2D0NF65_FLAN2|nr:hypothetical protein CRP01_07905 [Flavilitoribacter nigricans DSM 23189 = NBRC 102662]
MWIFNQLFKKKKGKEVTSSPELYLDYESKNGDNNFKDRYFPNVIELKKFLESISEREYYICIIIIAENIDWGNFHLWVKDDICKAKLNKHCEHHFPELGLPEIYYDEPPTKERVKFFNGYEVPAIQTITYDHIMSIIYSWLDGGWKSWVL